MFRLLLRVHPEAAEAEAATAVPATQAGQHAATPAPVGATDPLLPVEDPDWTQRRRIRAEMHLFRIERTATATTAAAQLTSQPAAAAAAQCTAKTTAAAVDSRAATPVQTEHDSATDDSNAATTRTTAAAATSAPVSPLPQPTDSRALLVVAVPHLLSSSHLLQELAGLSFSTVSAATRIICPRTGQHSLLLRFHATVDADTFFQRIHNHPFHALRREVAYVFQLAEGAVEEQAITPLNSPSKAPATDARAAEQSPAPVVLAAADSLELPCCPRCLSKLDSSLTEIVSELEDCSLVRVKSSRTNQWRTHRVPIWPEIRCETCGVVAAQANANNTATQMACRACIAAPAVSSSPSAATAAVADGCASASPLDSAHSLSRSTSTVHSSDNSLWICLLCAHIGCGRYASSGAAHAFAHHLATNHNFAMEVSMGAIWDYRNDGYIHRVHGAAATAASAAAAAAAASIAESAARSHASRGARKAGSTSEHKEDASSSDESDAEQQQQLVHWTRWNELPAVGAGRSSASSAPTAAPSALTRSSSAGFSLTVGGGEDPSASSNAELHALSLSAAASSPEDDVPSYGLDSEEASALLHSKLESIASFYNHLLTHTLQRQYEFFTQRIADLKADDAEQMQVWEPQIAAQTARDRAATATLLAEVDSLDASNRTLDRAVRDLSSKVSKLTEENAFIKDLNTRMLQDQMAQRKAQAAAQAAVASSPVKTNAGAALASSPSTPASNASAAASPSTPASSGNSSSAAAASASASPPPPSTPVAAAASAASASPSPTTPASAAACAAAASSSPATPASASSSSPSPASDLQQLHLQLDPLLVSKYAQLRDQKSRRTAALEKEVARLMEQIEAKSKKDAAAAAAKEAARKERVKRSMVGGIGAGAGAGGSSGGANSSASSRGRRG